MYCLVTSDFSKKQLKLLEASRKAGFLGSNYIFEDEQTNKSILLVSEHRLSRDEENPMFMNLGAVIDQLEVNVVKSVPLVKTKGSHRYYSVIPVLDNTYALIYE